MELILNNKQQRWVAVGLLLGCIALFVLGVLWPLLSKGLQYKETIDDLTFRLQRYNRVIASQDEVFQKHRETKSLISSQGYFNNKATGSLASADLQKFVKDLIEEAGGQLTSTQVLAQREEDQLIRIAVKVRMSGDIGTMQKVLYEIENAKPLMTVEELDIRPARGRRNPKTRRIDPSNIIYVNFEVANFMKVN
ncbi:MAG: type II secretion system protein GspM [Methylococcaceae bacterium]